MVVRWMEGRYQWFCWCDEGVFEYGLRLMNGAGSVHIYTIRIVQLYTSMYYALWVCGARSLGLVIVSLCRCECRSSCVESGWGLGVLRFSSTVDSVHVSSSGCGAE